MVTCEVWMFQGPAVLLVVSVLDPEFPLSPTAFSVIVHEQCSPELLLKS